MRALVSTGTSCWTASASSSEDSTEMCGFRTGGGEAIMDSEPDVSLDDEEEHDSTDDTKSSITQ
jgi:hypothetical protein